MQFCSKMITKRFSMTMRIAPRIRSTVTHVGNIIPAMRGRSARWIARGDITRCEAFEWRMLSKYGQAISCRHLQLSCDEAINQSHASQTTADNNNFLQQPIGIQVQNALPHLCSRHMVPSSCLTYEMKQTLDNG